MTLALPVSDKNVVSERLRFVQIFAGKGGLLQSGRRTGVEQQKLAIFHIMQRHFSDILRCVAVCNILL